MIKEVSLIGIFRLKKQQLRTFKIKQPSLLANEENCKLLRCTSLVNRRLVTEKPWYTFVGNWGALWYKFSSNSKRDKTWPTGQLGVTSGCPSSFSIIGSWEDQRRQFICKCMCVAFFWVPVTLYCRKKRRRQFPGDIQTRVTFLLLAHPLLFFFFLSKKHRKEETCSDRQTDR
jgi:hypothetical protein